jgi:hypothetical protein
MPRYTKSHRARRGSILDHPAAAFCRRLAPELEGLPVYVAVWSRLPEDRRGSRSSGGYTYCGLAGGLRDLIGEEWAGHGFAMVVNDANCDTMHEEDRRDYFLSTAVHELAHWLEDPAKWKAEAAYGATITPGRAVEVAKAITTWHQIAGERPRLEFHDADRHGPRFIRAAAHLYHRAGGHRSQLFPRDVYGGYQRPRWSGAPAYEAALGAELTRMAGRSFAEIHAEPPAPAFLALCMHDATPKPENKLEAA